MTIIPLIEEHWSQVQRIYEEGIATGHATFETKAPVWEKWDQDHLPYSRFVAIDALDLWGWGALSPVSGRCVYAGVGEVSVYVAPVHWHKGCGSLLLGALIEASEDNGLWTLQAGIFPENDASIRMHEKLGFRVVGFREKIGQMKGQWRDTLLLERRSKRV